MGLVAEDHVRVVREDRGDTKGLFFETASRTPWRWRARYWC
jgi:hypothetical protein